MYRRPEPRESTAATQVLGGKVGHGDLLSDVAEELRP